MIKYFVVRKVGISRGKSNITTGLGIEKSKIKKSTYDVIMLQLWMQ